MRMAAAWIAWTTLAVPALAQSGGASLDYFRGRNLSVSEGNGPESSGPPREGENGAELSAAPTEQLLFALQLQEQALLENYGNDHPQVRSLRRRIAEVRFFLVNHPPAPVKAAAQPAPVPRPAPTAFASEIIQAVQVRPVVPLSQPVSKKDTAPLLGAGPWHGRRSAVIPSAAAIVPPERIAAEGRPWIAAQSAGMLAAFLLGLLFHVGALGLILRWCASRWPSPFRIELIGGSPALPGAAETPRPAPSPVSLPAPAEERREAAVVVEPAILDLGPPSGGLLQQKEEARQQQEEAIFRHIFEQNLQLRARLEPAWFGDAS